MLFFAVLTEFAIACLEVFAGTCLHFRYFFSSEIRMISSRQSDRAHSNLSTHHAEILREGLPPNTCHVLGVTCHVSHVSCHVSHVTRPPDGGQYSHDRLMAKVSPPPSGQSSSSELCVS